ncbi:hypothetical protein WKT22_00472 [Candidatus Lokiarchaeum ossiferum]
MLKQKSMKGKNRIYFQYILSSTQNFLFLSNKTLTIIYLKIHTQGLITMEEFSAQLDISEDTQKVYGMVIMRGCITASSIASYLDMDISKAEQAISELKEKQLIKEASGIIPRYIPLPPLKGFTSYLGSYSDKIGETIQKIKAIEQTKTVNYDKITSKATEDMKTSLADQTGKLQAKYLEIAEKTEKSAKTIQETIQKVESEITTENTKNTENFISRIKEKTTHFQNENSKTFEDHEKALEVTLEKFPATIEQKFNAITLDKQQALGTLKTSYEQKNHELLLQFKTDTNNMVQSMESAINDVKNADTELFGTHENDLKSTIQQTNIVLKTLMDASVKDTTLLIESLKTSLSSIIGSFNDGFSSLTSNSIQGASSTYATSIQDIDQLLTSFKEDIAEKTASLYNVAKDELTKKIGDLKTSMEEKFTQKTSDLGSQFQRMQDQITSSLSTLQENYGKTTQTFLQDIQTKFSDHTTQIEDLSKTNETAFTDFSEKLIQEFTTSVSKLKNEYISQIEAQNSQRKDFTKKMEQDLNQQITTNNVELGKITEGAQNTIKMDIEEISKALNQDIKTTTEEYKEILSNADTHFKTEFDQFSTQLAENLKTSTSTYASKFKTSIDGSQSNVIEILENQQKSLQSTVDASTLDISTKAEATITQITDHTSKKIEESNSKLDQIEGTLLEKISTIKERNATQFTTLSDKTKAISTGFVEILTKSFEDLTSQVNEHFANQISSFDTFKQEGTDLVKEQYQGYQKSIAESFVLLKSNIATLASTDVDQLASEIEEKAASFMTNITNITKNVAGTLELTKGETTGIFKDIETSINEAIEQIKASVRDSIATGKKVLEIELGNVFETALTTMDSVKDLGDQPIQILNKVWDQMIAIDAQKAEKTWYLVGKEAVIPYIQSMIEQAKGKMTIVVPSIDDLPLELILTKRVRFTIITSVGAGMTDGRVDKLKEKGVTIMDYEGKDFIAVDRDSEEICFAAVDEKVDPITAIISELDPMITIMGSMIADYWRRVAKKL